MHARFVRGMGRSPRSGLLMLWHLKRSGLTTATFGYMVSAEGFDRIKGRLIRAIAKAAARGDYVVIGHSLGGVLLRAALNELLPARPWRKSYWRAQSDRHAGCVETHAAGRRATERHR